MFWCETRGLWRFKNRSCSPKWQGEASKAYTLTLPISKHCFVSFSSRDTANGENSQWTSDHIKSIFSHHHCPQHHLNHITPAPSVSLCLLALLSLLKILLFPYESALFSCLSAANYIVFLCILPHPCNNLEIFFNSMKEMEFECCTKEGDFHIKNLEWIEIQPSS